MHSSIGPLEEARLLYIEQSELSRRIADGGEPLVIYDVGLGLAANALGALECAKGAGRSLQVISFENDLDGIRYALTQTDAFPFLQNWKSAIEELLERGIWKSENLEWQVLEGDFLKLDLSKLPEPEMIFFDFYSPKVHPQLWGVDCFRKLFLKTEKRRAQKLRTDLYTYSSSRVARESLAQAGFQVGEGKPTSIKRNTTHAWTDGRSF
ncbi:methyltransferase [bacterium]|nr:methyltransferase [bacterium]